LVLHQTVLFARITSRASAAARRAATLHRPAARCEATANRQWLGQPPASGASGLQAAGGQLHALVRQRHAGTRIRAPEACDGGAQLIPTAFSSGGANAHTTDRRRPDPRE
jgi:hypothetical protein